MSTITTSTLPAASNVATTNSSAPKTPVATTTEESDLAETAVNLSAEAAAVSTVTNSGLGGYDAVSLLNFLQRTTPTTSLPNATSGAGGSTPGTSSTIDTTPSGTVGDWAALLKQNPALAYTAATDTFNQAVLRTLNIVA